MLIPPYTCVCDPSPIMDNPILIVHQGDFLLSIHLFRLPLSRIINYLWYVDAYRDCQQGYRQRSRSARIRLARFPRSGLC